MWDPPGSGIKPPSSALAGGFFTTEPPGKPLCSESLKFDTSPPLLEGGFSRGSLAGPGSTLNPVYYLHLYRVSLWGPQHRVNVPGVCVHLALPGWVSLASSLPVVLRFESLLWPRWPPRPHRVLGPGPTPMSPAATLGSLTCIFWVALFLSSSETRSSKTKLHPNTSASVRYFFSLTNSLKREIS